MQISLYITFQTILSKLKLILFTKICYPTFLRKNMHKLCRLFIENLYPIGMVTKLLCSLTDQRSPQSDNTQGTRGVENVRYEALPNIPF